MAGHSCVLKTGKMGYNQQIGDENPLQLQPASRSDSSDGKRAWEKEKPKKIFSRTVPDTHPGLDQQTVQIVVCSALTI